MQEMTIQVPEPLAEALVSAYDRLPEVLAYGLQHLAPQFLTQSAAKSLLVPTAVANIAANPRQVRIALGIGSGE